MRRDISSYLLLLAGGALAVWMVTPAGAAITFEGKIHYLPMQPSWDDVAKDADFVPLQAAVHVELLDANKVVIDSEITDDTYSVTIDPPDIQSRLYYVRFNPPDNAQPYVWSGGRPPGVPAGATVPSFYGSVLEAGTFAADGETKVMWPVLSKKFSGIFGLVFADADGNRLYGVGEEAGGIAISVENAEGTTVQTVTSNPQRYQQGDNFLFQNFRMRYNLQAGNYRLRLDLPPDSEIVLSRVFTKPLTLTFDATGRSQPFFLDWSEGLEVWLAYDGKPAIQVDAFGDVDDGNYSAGQQTLREALKRAGEKTEPVDIPIKIGGTIDLNENALFVNGSNSKLITIRKAAGSVTIDAKGDGGIFVVAAGRKLRIVGVNLKRGDTEDEHGGGVWNGGEFKAVDCAFEDLGGGVYTGEAAVTRLRNCYFSNCNAGSGGALLVDFGGNVEADNCAFTLSHETVFCRGLATFRHCTFFSSIPPMIEASGDGIVSISHCLLDPWVFSFGKSLTRGPVASAGYNLLSDSDPDFRAAPTDIQGRPSGIVQRRGVVGRFSFTLPAYSPAVNAGDPNFTPASVSPPLNHDILGNPRVADRIDIGAIEVGADKLALLEYLRELTGEEDANGNGIPDLIDALSGIDPTTDKAVDPPVKLVQGSPVASAMAAREEGTPALLSTVVRRTVEVRIDERITFAEGTLQTSEDLVKWTDRATYRGNGTGGGVLRTGANGATLVSQRQSGYCWFLHEEIDAQDGKPFFVRLKGMLEDE